MNKDDKHEPEKNLGRELATTTTGAIVGAAIGGPVGAVVGGAVGPVSEYINRVRKRQIERAAALAERSAQLAGLTTDELFSRLANDEKISDLGIRLLEIAAKSEVGDRDNAMAILMAQAVKDDGDESSAHFQMLGEILAELRSPHIQVLLFIADGEGVSPDSLLSEFADYFSTMRSIVRVLELHGLIVDENRLSSPPTNEISWTTSELGQAIVEIVLGAREEFSN